MSILFSQIWQYSKHKSKILFKILKEFLGESLEKTGN
jgi:hypothetical protein